jgi:large subunit ribosomal protein L5
MKTKYSPRLKTKYKEEVIPHLSSKLKIANYMRMPKIVKIVLNVGIGDAKDNANWLKQAVEEMSIISGQKPIITKSKKAISNFKLRVNDPVGVSVTLRKEKMYEFLDRFISAASPRIRDFRGLSNKGFDGRGNYNFGISEQIIFPEIDFDKVNKIRGMNISIVTTGQTNDESYELLRALGMPIKEKRTREKIQADEAAAAIEKVQAEEAAAAIEKVQADEAAAIEKTPKEEAVPVTKKDEDIS